MSLHVHPSVFSKYLNAEVKENHLSKTEREPDRNITALTTKQLLCSSCLAKYKAHTHGVHTRDWQVV